MNKTAAATPTSNARATGDELPVRRPSLAAPFGGLPAILHTGQHSCRFGRQRDDARHGTHHFDDASMFRPAAVVPGVVSM